MSSQWSGVHRPTKVVSECAGGYRASTSTQALAWGRGRQLANPAEGDVEPASTFVASSNQRMLQPLKEQVCSPSRTPTPRNSASHIVSFSELWCGHDLHESTNREPLPLRTMSKDSGFGSTRIVIKNTFYDVEEDRDSDDNVQRGLTRSFSAPLPRLVGGGFHDAETDGPEASPESVPSIGSAGHGTGSCRPCAWFWKAGGCQNGQLCRHCHLCSQDEIKCRRRAKYMKKKAQKAEKREKKMLQEMCELHGDSDVIFAQSDMD